MSSSSRSSRLCSQKPDLPIRPATDPLWTEEGFDEHEFRHVATWESPLRYKGVYQGVSLFASEIPGAQMPLFLIASLTIGAKIVIYFFPRSFSDWYYLDRVLSEHFPHCKIPSLPPRKQLWIKSQQTKLEEIALLILRCLSNKDIICKKVFQLFLQTNLCRNLIQENLEGKRNDLVSRVPNVEMEIKLEEEAKVIHFNLPKVNQNTYHGTSDSYKSVKNLFNDNRKRSLAYISENFNNLKQDRSLKSTLY